MVDHDPGSARSSGTLTTPRFDVTHTNEPNTTLLAGFSQFGLAGLTAVDYLVDHLDLEQTGHVTAADLPTITPFEQGVPRHPTRFFGGEDLDVTVLVGELFVPLYAAEAFSDALFDWMGANRVDEVAVLSGVPVAHGPEDHRTFYVASEDYRDRHLDDGAVAPMGNGFLDGINATLVSRGIDTSLAACVFTTPVHAQIPDVEAAIRLLETVDDVYDLGVDTGPLEEFAAEVTEYYEELSERVENVAEPQRAHDRMYM